MKVVLDTNVLISAFIKSGSHPETILRACLSGTIQFGMSKPLVDEFGRVLHKPKLVKLHRLTDKDISTLLQQLQAVADEVPVSAELHILQRDPTDSFVLDCAVNYAADFIVTGDPDLLDLKTYQDIRIIDPAECVKHIASLMKAESEQHLQNN